MQKEYDFSNAKRGAVLDASGKTRITIWIDDDVLQSFKAQAADEGRGYQTLMNEALKNARFPKAAPLTAETLRLILREELKAA
ncbi:hypothetical protein AGMMS49545_06120 [Betaproteobacteria bacterium]|nr:hypothetical protein AGMMS49545_06120 [Betaproteobacteria bacterium]GHU49024.1 hypothetical protein AGMMS50289_26040 [Betaproteobacteria bacterium]